MDQIQIISTLENHIEQYADRVFKLSLIAEVIFPIIYILIESLPIASNQSFLLALKGLVLSVISDLVAALLAYIVGYVVFSNIDKLRDLLLTLRFRTGTRTSEHFEVTPQSELSPPNQSSQLIYNSIQPLLTRLKNCTGLPDSRLSQEQIESIKLNIEALKDENLLQDKHCQRLWQDIETIKHL
jgi:hypothetical protein